MIWGILLVVFRAGLHFRMVSSTIRDKTIAIFRKNWYTLHNSNKMGVNSHEERYNIQSESARFFGKTIWKSKGYIQHRSAACLEIGNLRSFLWKDGFYETVN